MRIIHLKKLSLTNFKGIRSLTIDFKNHETFINGHNGTGKTTIFDAFLWLLFGKDSTDRKDFEIKTLGPDNQPFHRLDHEVEAVLNVDGDDISIKRSLREKWTKKRGSSEQEFTGHETTFFWNDVPMKESDYQKKVNDLVDEKVFKLLTNTSYFNAALKWQERRSVLLSIAGTITNEDVWNALGRSKEFEELVFVLGKKTVAEYRSEINAKKKKIKDELQLIPARIDEANRSLPEELNYPEIQEKIREAQTSLQEVEDCLMDLAKAQQQNQLAFRAKMNQLQDLRTKVMDIEFRAKNSVKERANARVNAIYDTRRTVSNLESQITRLKSDITGEENQKAVNETKQKALRDRWGQVNAEEFHMDDRECVCPTCKRSFDAEVIENKIAEFKKNFNETKSQKLEAITSEGKRLGETISLINTRISNLRAEIETINTKVAVQKERLTELEKENERLSSNEEQEVWAMLEADELYADACAKVKELEGEINTPQTSADNSDLFLRKRNLQELIAIHQKQLSTKEQREKTLSRISELETSEREMANELARLEGIEFSITQFEKAQMDLLESRINDRFRIVRFKLFDTQINGGEVPCCITLINGVPYSDANTASKAQAGLDIINVLSDHFGVVAPVFFDNRESVINVPETQSQIINLRVVEGAKLSVDKIEWMPQYKKQEAAELV